MPRNRAQRMFFAFVTVVITVHAFVFYSLYVVHGNTFMEATGASGVLEAIRMMGGVSVLGHNIPIWGVILIEFVLAYTLEMLLGSPRSFRIASHYFDPRKDHPFIFESMIICGTVLVMCPVMSFIAAILYYPFQFMPFDLFHFLAEWLKLVCLNFPFAFFTQLFFIQPTVRTVFKFVFRKDLAKRKEAAKAAGVKERPQDETEAIAAIFDRMDEIKAELKEELGLGLTTRSTAKAEPKE